MNMKMHFFVASRKGKGTDIYEIYTTTSKRIEWEYFVNVYELQYNIIS